jgi:hypothetical protein
MDNPGVEPSRLVSVGFVFVHSVAVDVALTVGMGLVVTEVVDVV